MSELEKTEALMTEITRFSEWRGAVKETLKHLASAIEQKEKHFDSVWEAIDTLREKQGACRERCDKVSHHKAEKTDLIDFKTDIKEVGSKVSKAEKAQIRLKVTMAFYGVIGGGLFTLLLFIGQLVLKIFKG